MAIHDVDKTNSDRVSPQPNSHDLHGVARSAASTTSINPTTDASGTTAYTQTANGRLLVNDGTTDRVIVGALPDGTFGMKVSQEGNDVTTATNDLLIFNSGQDMFKIVGTGTANLSVNGPGQSTVTVPHGLSYIPTVIAYASMSQIASGQQFLVPFQQIASNSGVGAQYVINRSIQLSVGSTNLNFYMASGNTETFTATVKYYLLQETAN